MLVFVLRVMRDPHVLLERSRPCRLTISFQSWTDLGWFDVLVSDRWKRGSFGESQKWRVGYAHTVESPCRHCRRQIRG